MTREAVLDGFERFIGDAIEQTAAEFSVSRAIGGQQGGVLDRISDSETVHQTLVKPELERYRTQTVTQFQLILDYVESPEPIDSFREEILDAGAFSDAIRDDLPETRKQDVRNRLTERHRSLGEAVVPVLESDESEFWEAARERLTLEEASALIEEQFAFTDPVTAHRDAFEMKTTIVPGEVLGGIGGLLGDSAIEVEFTDEAVRAMGHAEREVIADAKQKAKTQFEK